MTITLSGAGSTNSRGHRPLPPGVKSACTLWTGPTREVVRFEHDTGEVSERHLLSWVGGQWGSVFGNSAPGWALDAYGFAGLPGSYGHKAEYDLTDALGEALDSVFGGAELACRFYQDGGTALNAAARLARHATGRSDVASFGYHGAGHEWAHEPNVAGHWLPSLAWHRRFDWGDVGQLRMRARHCAAVCVEVPALDDADAIAAFLRECRAACDAGGAVFILDEVVTGFRLALGGAAELYGVTPDIACYGKAISATGCVSAIVGKRELVEPIGGDVFLSTTFGGAPGPCAVAAATVKRLTQHRAEWLGRGGALYATGTALKRGLGELGVRVAGQPERSVVQFDSDALWLTFCSAMIGEGVVIHRPQFPSLCHTLADVTTTLDAAVRVLEAARA